MHTVLLALADIIHARFSYRILLTTFSWLSDTDILESGEEEEDFVKVMTRFFINVTTQTTLFNEDFIFLLRCERN
jgi:hypothetical protein